LSGEACDTDVSMSADTLPKFQSSADRHIRQRLGLASILQSCKWRKIVLDNTKDFIVGLFAVVSVCERKGKLVTRYGRGWNK
jgi:hypothetical protein